MKLRNNRAFTLIELLVVVLILGILMAIALPLYLGAQERSERATCRGNMQTILNAAQAYKLTSEDRDWPTAVSDMVSTDGDLVAEPRCPSGDGNDGDYSLSDAGPGGSPQVSCEIDATHGTFQAGDHQ